MITKEIVMDWLKSKGYDGLYNDFCGGCGFDDGFMSCEEWSWSGIPSSCVPAYKRKITRAELKKNPDLRDIMCKYGLRIGDVYYVPADEVVRE